MARNKAGLLAAVALAGFCAPAGAQAPIILTAAPPSPPPAAPGPAPANPNAQLEAALVDLPVGTLPPPAQPPSGVPGPYFQHDPLLDPAELPQPGWLLEPEFQLLNPHVRYWSEIRAPVALSNGGADTVSVPGAHLAWAAAPMLTAGYRLPSGFGEVVLSARYFGTVGDQLLPVAPDGPASVRTRLDVTTSNIDYRSSEFSLWPGADALFYAGGEFGNFFFDSRQTTPLAEAAAGSGVTGRHVANRFVGFGPHAGVRLNCFLYGRELALQGSFEAADLFGRITQEFDETTTATAAGPAATGVNRTSSSQSVPTITAQLGLSWSPQPDMLFFLGGQYQYYWNVGRESEPNFTIGELYDAGFVFRASFSY
jgi:hypothetical protein